MPTYEITAPNGKKYRIKGQGSKEEALQHLQQQLGGQTETQQPPVPEAASLPPDRNMPMGEMSLPNIQYRTELQKRADKLGIDNATTATQQGFLGGWADEASAAFNAPFHAAYDWFKGGDLDVGRAYTALHQQLEAKTKRRREEHPIASLAGEVVGGLATGAGLVKAPQAVLAAPGYVTAAKQAIAPIVAKVTQAAPKATQYAKVAAGGAGYGALSGAGEAKPGERLQGAAEGAVVGALTGVGTQAVGNKIVSAVTNRAARKAAGPASGDLATAGRAFYDAAEAEGVRYAPHAVQRLGVNVRAAAGRLNEKSRPLTMGTVEDALDKFAGNRSVSFEEFAEFRQDLNTALRTAKPTDVRTLKDIKGAVDSWANQVQGSSADFTGDAIKAFGFQKQADQLWARAEKTKVYENIWDDIQRKGAGHFTQGGLANAAKSAMESYYKQIRKQNFRGHSKEEVALIKQMAAGGSASTMMRLLSKFDPKGAISLFTGLSLGGPVLTGAGYVAGRAREAGMEKAMQRLLSGAATGGLPADVVAQPARNLVPAVTGASAASMEADRRLRALQGR